MYPFTRATLNLLYEAGGTKERHFDATEYENLPCCAILPGSAWLSCLPSSLFRIAGTIYPGSEMTGF